MELAAISDSFELVTHTSQHTCSLSQHPLTGWCAPLCLCLPHQQKRMNLTKTIHKTPVDANLVRQGWTEQEKARIQPKYDRDYTWVSVGLGLVLLPSPFLLLSGCPLSVLLSGKLTD